MNNHIKITEEDLFRFVHYPESLSREIFEYISNNRSRFSEEIEFCSCMPVSLNAESDSLNEKLIEIVRNFRTIELMPSFANQLNGDRVKLAASSIVPLKPCFPISFQSSDEKYLIRIIEKQTQHYLYLFTPDTINAKYSVKVFPSENRYVIEDRACPAEIIGELNIEKIFLEIT